MGNLSKTCIVTTDKLYSTVFARCYVSHIRHSSGLGTYFRGTLYNNPLSNFCAFRGQSILLPMLP